MKYGITSCAFVDSLGKENLVSQMQRVKDYGYDIFQIFEGDLNLINIEEINRAKEIVGIEVSTLMTLKKDADISDEDAAIRKAGVELVQKWIDISEAIGSSMLTCPLFSRIFKMRGCTPAEKAQQWDWAVENSKILVDYAAKKNVTLAVEPCSRYYSDFLNTAEQAMDYISRIGDWENLGILLDTYHMNMEERNMVDAFRTVGKKLVGIHASSVGRGTPGNDSFNWAGIRQVCDEIGFHGPIIIEAFTQNTTPQANARKYIYRPVDISDTVLAVNGLRFLKSIFD